MDLFRKTYHSKRIEYIVKDQSSRIFFTAVTVLGLIIVTSVFIYSFILPSKTIENLVLNVSINAYGYSNNFQFIIMEGSIIIHNNGPLDVLLRESEIEITVDNNTYVKFQLSDSILLKTDESYQYAIAPPDLIINDEKQLIFDSIMDHHIEIGVILYSDAVVGGREHSIERRYYISLVFLHLPTDVRP